MRGQSLWIVYTSFFFHFLHSGHYSHSHILFKFNLLSPSLLSIHPNKQTLLVFMVGRDIGGGDPAVVVGSERWSSEIMNGNSIRLMEAEYVRRYHRHEAGDNQHQCSSALVKHIRAPVHLVWSLVRSFDQPQKYKPFVSRCCVVEGDHNIGSVREVNVKSGLPATTSTERLEFVDENERILSVKILGGDHRLRNYSSITTVHPEVVEGRPGTLVIESFVVDVPDGNTKDETCYFVEALLKCNLKSLADVSEHLAGQHQVQPVR